ncbi:MAG: hypothetical protein JXR96_26590 [Deltaproteobacteria bacterium]|nr:hypothetical protein [Deltaproteobacteria bacterium]
MKRPVLLCSILALALAAPMASPGPDAQADEAFGWFQGLGLPDLAGKPFVRVATGEWIQTGAAPPRNTFVLAFLRSERAGRFELLTVDLFERAFEKTPAGTAEHLQVGYARLDFDSELRALLDRLASQDAETRWQQRFGERLSLRAELFVLACYAHANGRPALAREIFARAIRTDAHGRRLASPAADPLSELQKDLGHAMMWRAVEAFGDPRVGREALLARFEAIGAHYPACEHVERAAKTAAALRRMIAEDEAHRAQPLESLPQEEKIAELVFQLRDQNGQQWSQPGACDVFLDPRGERSPAHQLAAIGYPAVPRLIAALEDGRPTRSVGFHRDFYFSHYVLTVGDCARAVLERIAGRSFYQRACTGCSMTRDGKAADTKAQVEAWWAELRAGGERALLVKAAARGDAQSPSQASRLLRLYPDAALQAVRQGARRAEDAWVRTALVDIAAAVPGDAPIDFLREELDRGPELAARVAAARGLHSRSRPEAAAAMIREWRRVAKSGPGVEELIAFLAGCGRAEAVRALGEDLRDRPVGIRLAVVSAFGESASFSSFSTGQGGGLQPAGRAAGLPEDVRVEIEALLVAALDDETERVGMSGSWDGKSFSDPRICDVAGHVLSKVFAKRCDFDLSASILVRDRQRIACTNAWLRARGRPLRPLPASKRIAPVDPARIAPLLAALRGGSAAEVEAAEAAVSAIGLPALEALQGLARELPADHPARARVGPLARRIACTLSELEFSGPVEPDGELAALARSLKGKPLAAEGLVVLLRRFANRQPPGASALRLRAVRHEDGCGVHLRIELDRSRSRQEGSCKGWATAQRVGLGSEDLLGSFGSCSLEHAREAEAYESLHAAISKALAAPPELPFIIRASLVREE